MFLSVLELFKIGIGPSSSHTLGPMVAANDFMVHVRTYVSQHPTESLRLRCTLKGSLAYTGKGHATDSAVTLGLHGYTAKALASEDVEALIERIRKTPDITMEGRSVVSFSPDSDIVFDKGDPLPEHANGMIFTLQQASGMSVLSKTYFSIGGGFVSTLEEIHQLVAPLKLESAPSCPYPFDTSETMMRWSDSSGLSIAAMKRRNELEFLSDEALDKGLDEIWHSMLTCLERGLVAEGFLPGGLELPRRAKHLHEQLLDAPQGASLHDWLCAYAMAVNEENAAGHMVVTAPTNGAAGVIPAVLYYFVKHEGGTTEQIREFLLTAAAIGGIIKHQSSISGAEVGCQGEVGSAASMAAAGLCAVRGGKTKQIENAAEIALEHHLGMTCDPVKGLVQIPCIERNGFGAVKAYVAASLALRCEGDHYVPLDSCIAAMKQTGLEMSQKFKETALGGLAVSITEC
ncbi:MAG: L-serine ammonia-lyase [Gammaproteobacteria bacterium]|nr:L-serine ammonia-lyase [Gammaproteobacteria bacterium]